MTRKRDRKKEDPNGFERIRKYSGWIWLAVLPPLALVIGLVVDSYNLFDLFKRNRFPAVDIAYYERDDRGRLSLVDPTKVDIPITFDNVLNNYIEIPINIAVRNNENEDLSIAKIEISYDRDLNVSSSGVQRIDPNGRLLIFEHDLGTLPTVNQFTPIKTVDILRIPFSFQVTKTIILSKDGVPIYALIIVGYSGNPFEKDEIEFGFRISVLNRKPIEGLITFGLNVSVDAIFTTDGATLEYTDVTESDIQLFTSLPNQFGSTIDAWEQFDSYYEMLFSYYKIENSGGIFQYIYVDDQIRRMIVDIDKDGLADFEVHDTSMDGMPDVKIEYHPSIPMVDWSEEAITP